MASAAAAGAAGWHMEHQLRAAVLLHATCLLTTWGHPSPQQVLFADEISTGLDSATTHDIVQVRSSPCLPLAGCRTTCLAACPTCPAPCQPLRAGRQGTHVQPLPPRLPPASPNCPIWPPMQAMKRTTRYLNSTMLVALLQPAPETLELFDDIMVLSSGKVCMSPCFRLHL